jgi:hypothetical protein
MIACQIFTIEYVRFQNPSTFCKFVQRKASTILVQRVVNLKLLFKVGGGTKNLCFFIRKLAKKTYIYVCVISLVCTHIDTVLICYYFSYCPIYYSSSLRSKRTYVCMYIPTIHTKM